MKVNKSRKSLLKLLSRRNTKGSESSRKKSKEARKKENS